jgi:hypothetical protein
MYCGNILGVCEYYGSLIDMYGVLEECGRIIVVCEYNASVVDAKGYE